MELASRIGNGSAPWPNRVTKIRSGPDSGITPTRMAIISTSDRVVKDTDAEVREFQGALDAVQGELGGIGIAAPVPALSPNS
jgi:hypothetical protein